MSEETKALIQEFKNSFSQTLKSQCATCPHADAIGEIQKTLVSVQLSVARIETSNKVLSAVGAASTAGVVALLVKMLTAP